MQGINAKRKYFFYCMSIVGLVISVAIVSVLLGLHDSGRDVLRKAYWQNGINVYAVTPESGMEADSISFFDKNEKQIRQELKEIKSITPVIEVKGGLKSYKTTKKTDIIATGKDYSRIYNLKLLYGRFLSEEDMKSKSEALVIDDITAYKLFGKINAVGREVELSVGRTSAKFDIVGIINNYNKDIENLYTKKIEEVCFIPESSFLELGITADKTEILLQASNSLKKDEFSNKIDHYFLKHGLGDPETERYDQLKQVATFLEDKSIIMLLTAVLAYMLGCICFMNAITLAVAERKVELAMAYLYGAGYGEMRDEILYRVELAAVFSGAAGIVIGMLCGAFIGRFLNVQMHLSLTIAAVAFGMTSLAGIAAAIYPLGIVKRMNISEMLWD